MQSVKDERNIKLKKLGEKVQAMITRSQVSVFSSLCYFQVNTKVLLLKHIKFYHNLLPLNSGYSHIHH